MHKNICTGTCICTCVAGYFIHIYVLGIVSTGVGKVSQKKYGRCVKQNLNHHYKMDCHLSGT